MSERAPAGLWVLKAALYVVVAVVVLLLAMLASAAFAGSPGGPGGGASGPGGPGPGAPSGPSDSGPPSGSPSGPGGDGPAGGGVVIVGPPSDGCVIGHTGVRLCGPDPGPIYLTPMCGIVREDKGKLLLVPCR